MRARGLWLLWCVLLPLNLWALDLATSMGQEDFNRCGLQKLDSAELQALETWITDHTRPDSTQVPQETTLLSNHSVNLGQAPFDQAGPLVCFSSRNRKYHCPDCRWAWPDKAETELITRLEAVRKGGAPCFTCNGRCE